MYKDVKKGSPDDYILNLLQQIDRKLTTYQYNVNSPFNSLSTIHPAYTAGAVQPVSVNPMDRQSIMDDSQPKAFIVEEVRK